MCTFENKRSVLVCDLAIQHVREAVSAAFGDAMEFTPISGQGTRVAAKSAIDAEAFQAVTRAAIAAAQEKTTTGSQ
jgi:hypothetical protein